MADYPPTDLDKSERQNSDPLMTSEKLPDPESASWYSSSPSVNPAPNGPTGLAQSMNYSAHTPPRHAPPPESFHNASYTTTSFGGPSHNGYPAAHQQPYYPPQQHYADPSHNYYATQAHHPPPSQHYYSSPHYYGGHPASGYPPTGYAPPYSPAPPPFNPYLTNSPYAYPPPPPMNYSYPGPGFAQPQSSPSKADQTNELLVKLLTAVLDGKSNTNNANTKSESREGEESRSSTSLLEPQQQSLTRSVNNDIKAPPEDKEDFKRTLRPIKAKIDYNEFPYNVLGSHEEEVNEVPAEPSGLELALWKNSGNNRSSVYDEPEEVRSVRPTGQLLSSSKPGKEDFSVLILGETGSGKSTFINYFANFFLGGKIDETGEKIFIAVPTPYFRHVTPPLKDDRANERNLGRNSMQAQTLAPKVYRFKYGIDVFSLIDTPGLSDTEGSKQDDDNIEKILGIAQKLESLTAIILVINGTASRLTFNLKNVLTRFKGTLPDSVRGNIFVVFTNCSSKFARNFKLELLEEYFNPRAIFHMQNLAFSTDPKEWRGKELKEVQYNWQQSFEEIEQLVEKISQTPSVTTRDFRLMKELRHQIKEMLNMSRIKIQKLQSTHDAIVAYQEAAKQHGSNMFSFQNFIQKTEKSELKRVPTAYHNTICSSCNSVCHEHCGLQEEVNTGTGHFVSCAAIANGYCKYCVGKCSHDVHYHGRFKFSEEIVTVEETLYDIKAKYEMAEKGKQQAEKDRLTAEQALALIEHDIAQEKANLEAKCAQLKKICSGFNLVEELHIHVQQLESEARMLKSVDARTQAMKYIRSIVSFMDTLSNGTYSANNSNDQYGSGHLERRKHWAKDENCSECHECRKKFSVFQRKHHCRHCGNIFCGSCSDETRVILALGYDKPVRVCKPCSALLPVVNTVNPVVAFFAQIPVKIRGTAKK